MIKQVVFRCALSDIDTLSQQRFPLIINLQIAIADYNILLLYSLARSGLGNEWVSTYRRTRLPMDCVI